MEAAQVSRCSCAPWTGRPPCAWGTGMSLALSPDARWVLSLPYDSQARLSLTPTGAGEPRPLRPGKIARYYDAFWLSDGESGVLLAAEETGRPRRLFIQDLPDGEPRPITPRACPRFSIRSRRTASGSQPASWSRVLYALYPVTAGEPRPIPGLQPREQPLGWKWRRPVVVRADAGRNAAACAHCEAGSRDGPS